VKVVAAWSGGKDSCFAYYKAVKEGLEVISLLTFMHSEELSNFHGIPVDLLFAQADALGLPLVKRVTKPNMYEQQFKETLLEF
jgi:diphthamide synthase (EF-2-diphthine--ammonia ligase)